MADYGAFVKRPIQIDAYHYMNYTSFMIDMQNREIPEWIFSEYRNKRIRLKDPEATKKVMIIASKDGDYIIKDKDWIIKYPDDSLGYCHPDIFNKIYERLDS